MKVLFVINPVSGGKEKRDWEEQIRAYFRNSEHNMDFYLLTGSSDEVSVRHHITSVQPQHVVGCGRYGTIKMLPGLRPHTIIPLEMFPAGSANGMARELEIPIDVNTALDISVNGMVKPIDVIRINEDEICIHLSDLG